MATMTHYWQARIERGPGWLVVRLTNHLPPESPPAELTDWLWSLLSEHLAYRLVLELAEDQPPSLPLWQGLADLHARLQAQGGTLRLCGLSDAARESIAHAGLDARLVPYASRHEAVHGYRPHQPR